MFYSQFILAKKGPLGTIWIAAHLERKLRKNQVADTDIGVSVDSILFPDAPIALRLSSHLLLGVVRIYSRKVGYLFDDCSDALLKVKQAFRSTAVDLPPEESTAPYHSITLPETFDLDDFELPDTTDILQGNYVDHHVSSREQITLQDNMEGVVFSTSQFGLDERFGDGDTSGLDLDELDNQVRQADTAGYAQAPCTPGLAEEPNLSTAQEVYVCDDHQELEELNFSNINVALACKDHQDSANDDATNLSMEDNLMRMTTNSDFYSDKENEASGSLLNDVNPAAGSDGQKINDLNTLADFPSPAWTPFPEGHVEAMSPASEYPEGNLTLLNGVNGIQNEVISNDGQEIPDQLEPKALKVGQLSLEHLNLNGVDGVENMENSYPLSNSVPTNIESPSRNYPKNFEIHSPEHQNDPKFSSLTNHENMEIADTHVLKPCKYPNQPSATIPDSDVPVAPHLQSGVPEICSKEALGSNEARPLDSFIKVQELALMDNNQLEFGTSNDQYNNVLSVEHQLDVSNGNMISELPAPEKLLSAPVGHEDDQVHLLESTPNREHSVLGDVDDTRTKIISGKKRSITESTLTMDSLNSFESLGVVQSKRYKDSVPDDNDLLSSILVGRYSALKLKPTPPPEKTSKKRPRCTARASSSKRKVIVDDTMVLHGDQIRQQLTHTGDIRRMRKKAPCTRAEIWMIQKEFLDEENFFTEPIFTGYSSVLASIYSHAYDLSDINLLINEAQKETQEAICHEMPVHEDINLDKETEKEVNQESILVNSAMEVQSPGKQQDKSPLQISPLVHSEDTSDMHINGKINLTSNAINPLIVNGVESTPEVHSGESFDMHVNGESNPTADAMNPSIVNGVESTSLVDSVSVDKLTGSIDLSNGVQLDAAADALHDQRLETQFSEMEAFDLNASSEKVVDANIFGADLRAGNEFPLEETEVGVSAANGANILSANDPQDHFLVTSDEVVEGLSKNELGVVNEVENVELDVDGTFSIVYDSGIDPAEASAHHVEVLNSDVRGVSFSDAENLGCRSPNLQNEMNPETGFVDYNAAMDHADLEYNVDGHDTGFLNEDDDEVTEEGDDCAPSAAHIGFIDNSGWSSRTRAVAKYLQVLFDKETEQGKKALPMNNLLVGKTRKEASRMFFEALVLKTRDYIHVEQEAPFDNINLKPRGKLMKADF